MESFPKKVKVKDPRKIIKKIPTPIPLKRIPSQTEVPECQLEDSAPSNTRPNTIPQLPCLDFYNSPPEQILEQIQSYIVSFGYNYTVTPFYRLKKSGTTSHVFEVFHLLSTYGLPIQCVEAVFIGAVLTAGWQGSIRIPLSFKSKFMHPPQQPSTSATSQIYRHIVLAVYQNGKWGALGISRRNDLMDKRFEYNSLWDLIEEYYQCYGRNYHRLLSVYCGLPLPHNFLQDDKIVWKSIKFRMFRSDVRGNDIIDGGSREDELIMSRERNLRKMEDFLRPYLLS
eukprot:gene10796-11767_t